MCLHGFASVTPFILSRGAHVGGGLTHVSTWFSLSILFSQGEKGGFNICPYMAFPLSLHSSYRKVKRGVVLKYFMVSLSPLFAK